MSTEKESAKQNQFKLYLVRISPCCRIVWLYLLQNKLPVEISDVDVLEGEHKSDNFTALNPHHEVPVLVDGKTVVFEGIAILRYLAYKYTSYSGWGKTLGDRANVLSVMNWACCSLHRVLGYRYVYPHFLEKYHLKTHDDTEIMVEKAAEQLTKHLEVMENFYLKKSPFLCGKDLTIADSYAATILCQCEWLDFDIGLWPRVSAWFKKVKGQELWGKVHEKHEEFLHRLSKYPHE
ncbi:glutathione S-transferase theta-1-like [Actinia tenebrosa]|uniref:Glutathione S-transferase theta-1-like n=1 Tax=Actinia tenebrosa TaxID=6105 RepID=A0A6P8I3A3_ACTTE|nr:glutathione S-transferase theta-1-like [Actinia tenebrosa]XP_031561986.1 glutathione S-transferase theta-1-like [Actinia tenebrosa]